MMKNSRQITIMLNSFLILTVLVVVVIADAVAYGVDESFPMHHPNITDGENPLGDRQHFYNEFMKGCTDQEKEKADLCWAFEQQRIKTNQIQPQSMVNYTSLGFKKVQIPEDVWQTVQKFWGKSKEKLRKPEDWPEGSSSINHWSSPTHLVDIVESSGIRGGGESLQRSLYEATRTVLQEWSSQELEESGMNGIRIYTNGAILSTHVDQLPNVLSATLNVAQECNEDWPIEAIGHDGKAYNITLQPGELFMYESHSVLHGRPFPLNGNYHANIFVHFTPTGHSLNKNTRNVRGHKIALDKKNGIHHVNGKRVLPPYIIPNSPQDKAYREEHPDTNSLGLTKHGSSHAHFLAGKGQTNELVDLIEDQLHLVHSRDKNGWTPLHEAARGGHVEATKYLLEKGAPLNERFLHGQGGTALFLAGQYHGEDSEIFKYLKSLGAVWLEPGQDL